MQFSNEKIERLINERNRKIAEMNREIQNEIDKERKRHQFSWPRFLMLLAMIIVPIVMFKLNGRLFPKESIWSWGHYIEMDNLKNK